jgi:hypothetical protein
MGTGVEHQPKGGYAGKPEEHHEQRSTFPHLAAYLALLLSFIALVTIIIIYSGTDLDRVGPMQENLAQTDARVDALSQQVRMLEQRAVLGQEAVIDSLIADVTAKMRFLAEQPLTPEQRQDLRQAFQAPAPEQREQQPQPQGN